MNYPVVIVGAGPAGMACAIRLIKAGIPHCVIDKKEFPRKKLCGGLVTQKTYDLIRELLGDDEMLASLFSRSVSTCHAALYRNETPLCAVETAIPFQIIDRLTFDDALVRFYRSLGGNFLLGEVVHADFDGKLLQLSDGTNIGYDLLVAADGVHSVIRREAGLTIRNRMFCLETENTDTASDELRLYFDVLKNGYGWSFPTAHGRRIGFGSRYQNGYDYKEHFRHYLTLTDNGTTPQTESISGAFVPYGGYLKKPCFGDNVAFIGDAAGFADPLSAEGLYYAFLSGKQIADAVIDAPESPVNQYRKSAKAIGREIYYGNILKTLFFSKLFHPLVITVMRDHPGFVRFFLDQHVSTARYHYGELPKMLAAYKRNKTENSKNA